MWIALDTLGFIGNMTSCLMLLASLLGSLWDSHCPCFLHTGIAWVINLIVVKISPCLVDISLTCEAQFIAHLLAIWIFSSVSALSDPSSGFLSCHSFWFVEALYVPHANLLLLYAFQVCDLSFTLFILSFVEQKFLILMQQIQSFMVCIFLCLLSKVPSSQGHQNVPSVLLSSGNLKVFTFCFELAH